MEDQHGFVLGRSKVTNLINAIQFIFEELDSSGQVDVIHTDFSKAFDKFGHGILSKKLSNCDLT